MRFRARSNRPGGSAVRTEHPAVLYHHPIHHDTVYIGVLSHISIFGVKSETGISNSMIYRHQNSRKSKFATEPEWVCRASSCTRERSPGSLPKLSGSSVVQ
jgi:hypothetical protein